MGLSKKVLRATMHLRKIFLHPVVAISDQRDFSSSFGLSNTKLLKKSRSCFKIKRCVSVQNCLIQKNKVKYFNNDSMSFCICFQANWPILITHLRKFLIRDVFEHALWCNLNRYNFHQISPKVGHAWFWEKCTNSQHPNQLCYVYVIGPVDALLRVILRWDKIGWAQNRKCCYFRKNYFLNYFLPPYFILGKENKSMATDVFLFVFFPTHFANLQFHF